MSIINEALKKTEESIQKNSLKETSGLNKKPRFNAYLFYILIFVIGLSLSSFIFVAINRKVEPPIAFQGPDKTIPTLGQKPEAAQTLPAVTLSPLPEVQDKPEKNFILNGIFFSDNDGYALVNNQIVREDDSVDGAKVEKITENTVELNNQGNIITLSTNR
ncbi:MAG: hypothetical protein PHC37_05210 [Candidatus Omnitrophica bacterium]|nr:hypothetical protein [Candidatus Omnitrophota bacterium]MDD5691074.1 hypothetical protein [Candidatus Omnitrophota bacterium]